MLMRGDEARVLAKGGNIGGRRAGQWSAATVVDGRGRALESFHEADSRVSIVEEGYVVAGAARPVFPQFGDHGDSWNIRSTPGSSVAHDAAGGRSIVGGAVGIGAQALAWNSWRIEPEIQEIGGRVGGLVAAGNVRVQHRDHLRLLEVAAEIGSNRGRAEESLFFA